MRARLFDIKWPARQLVRQSSVRRSGGGRFAPSEGRGRPTSDAELLPSSFALLVPKRQHRSIIIRPKPGKTSQNQVKIGTFFSACQTEAPATNLARRRTHLWFEAKTEDDGLKPANTEPNGALFFLLTPLYGKTRIIKEYPPRDRP